MSTQYFRITAYHPTENLSIIIDSNGMYEKLWQFSSFLVQKGFQIMEVSTGERFLDINITKAEPCTDKLVLRGIGKGKPVYTEQIINGITHKVVDVEGKQYVAL